MILFCFYVQNKSEQMTLYAHNNANTFIWATMDTCDTDQNFMSPVWTLCQSSGLDEFPLQTYAACLHTVLNAMLRGKWSTAPVLGKRKKTQLPITWDNSYISSYPNEFVKSVLTFIDTRGFLSVWNHLKLSWYLPYAPCRLPNMGEVHHFPLKLQHMHDMLNTLTKP